MTLHRRLCSVVRRKKYFVLCIPGIWYLVPGIWYICTKKLALRCWAELGVIFAFLFYYYVALRTSFSVWWLVGTTRCLAPVWLLFISDSSSVLFFLFAYFVFRAFYLEISVGVSISLRLDFGFWLDFWRSISLLFFDSWKNIFCLRLCVSWAELGVISKKRLINQRKQENEESKEGQECSASNRRRTPGRFSERWS